MPDNPLRFTRRNKARAEYAPIVDSDSPNLDSVEMHGIRPTVTVAASSSTSARRNVLAGKGKAKRQDKYVDDPEEEASLLKGDVYSADGIVEYGDIEEQLGAPTSVCFLREDLCRSSWQDSYLPLHYYRNGRLQGIILEQYHSDHQVRVRIRFYGSWIAAHVSEE